MTPACSQQERANDLNERFAIACYFSIVMGGTPLSACAEGRRFRAVLRRHGKSQLRTSVVL